MSSSFEALQAPHRCNADSSQILLTLGLQYQVSAVSPFGAFNLI